MPARHRESCERLYTAKGHYCFLADDELKAYQSHHVADINAGKPVTEMLPGERGQTLRIGWSRHKGAVVVSFAKTPSAAKCLISRR